MGPACDQGQPKRGSRGHREGSGQLLAAGAKEVKVPPLLLGCQGQQQDLTLGSSWPEQLCKLRAQGFRQAPRGPDESGLRAGLGWGPPPHVGISAAWRNTGLVLIKLPH